MAAKKKVEEPATALEETVTESVTATSHYKVNTERLRVRAEPSLNGSVHNVALWGDTVVGSEVVADDGVHWCKVHTINESVSDGFVMIEFLEKLN